MDKLKMAFIASFIIVVLAILILSPVISDSQVIDGHQGGGRTWFTSNSYVNRPSGAGFYLELPTLPFRLKVISLSGNAYDRGFEYGFLAGPEIYSVITWLFNEQAYNRGVPLDQWKDRLESESRLYTKFIPTEYLEEMTGIADGFNFFQKLNPEYMLGYNVTLLDVIAINTKINITGVGATVSGNLTVSGVSILGTTIETDAPKHALLYVVETPPQGRGHRIAYYTIAGRIFQNGFNDAGLGLIANPVERWNRVIGIPEVVRNRVIIQYADNVSGAIKILHDLQEEYGFSGLGDDLAITDQQGNIAKLEITPFVTTFTVNPGKPPTWPPVDPYLKSNNNSKSIYNKLYIRGYSNVLRGIGWIVNSLYTFNDTIIGIPGHPANWSEAISPAYTWMWSNPKAYLLAHYLYNYQLRRSQVSLQKLVEFTQSPPFTESPKSSGLIWMEPQLGIVSIVNGYPVLGKPVYLDVFIPVPNLEPPVISYREIYSAALNLRLSSTILSELIQRIEPIIHASKTTPNNITIELQDISRTLMKSSTNLERLSGQINGLEEECSVVQKQRANISNGLASIDSKVNSLTGKSNTIVILQETTLTLLAILVLIAGYTALKTKCTH